MPAPESVGLPGEHQRDNARIAAVLGARIGASPAAIRQGIADARWPGRLERIDRFLLDAAHNPDGALALSRHLRSLGRPPEDVALVFGALADKDWSAMLDALAPLAAVRRYVAPRGGVRDGVEATAMAARYPGEVTRSTEEALSHFAGGRGPGLIVIAGSIVLVGEARGLLLGLPRDPPVAL